MKNADEHLVLKAQQGDNNAFDKLVKKYQDKVLYLAYDLVGSYDDAQDIAQNAFLRAYHNLNRFKGEASFSTWLYRIVVNLTIDFRRAETRKRQILIEEPIDEYEKNTFKDKQKGPDQLLELKDINDQIEIAINKLPHHQRVAFVLRHYYDMSMKEIAEILKCEPGTVRSHLFRATNKLRAELKEFMTA